MSLGLIDAVLTGIGTNAHVEKKNYEFTHNETNTKTIIKKKKSLLNFYKHVADYCSSRKNLCNRTRKHAFIYIIYIIPGRKTHKSAKR